MTITSPDTAEQQIDKITSFIETAEKLIHQGKTVDVHALEDKVSALCATLETLPPNESQHLIEPVEHLFSVIERLEKDLDMQHDAMTERLQHCETSVNPLFAQEVSDEDK